MKRLKHLFKYVFNSAYRFECNRWIKLEPERLKTMPLMGRPSFSQEDVKHLKALRDAVEVDAKKIAQLLVDAGMATWRSERPDNHEDAEKFKKAFNNSVNDPSRLIGNEAQDSLGLFAQTLDIIIAEVKRQFLNGAQRIVLTRDGDSVFCEPDDGQ